MSLGTRRPAGPQRAHTGAGAALQEPMRHDANMDTSSELTQRLIDLEIKLGFTEDLVDHLNALVAKQQQQIEQLQQALGRMAEQVSEARQGQGLRSLRDELPPHY